jgi:hypothetical protein
LPVDAPFMVPVRRFATRAEAGAARTTCGRRIGAGVRWRTASGGCEDDVIAAVEHDLGTWFGLGYCNSSLHDVGLFVVPEVRDLRRESV